MNNELLTALVASSLTAALGGVGSLLREKKRNSEIIKKAKTYIIDELNVIESILSEIDNVLSNTKTLPIQKIQSLNRFTYPSETLKRQIVELPNEDTRRKINMFYDELFNTLNADFSGAYSLNEQDQAAINAISDARTRFKELKTSIGDIKKSLIS